MTVSFPKVLRRGKRGEIRFCFPSAVTGSFYTWSDHVRSVKKKAKGSPEEEEEEDYECDKGEMGKK